MGQQCGHAILSYGREQTFATAEGHLALHFPLKVLCQRGGHFIPEGIRHNYKDPILTGPHLLGIEIGLLGHLQDMAVPFQDFGASIRPALAQLAEEPMSVQPLYLVHHLLEQIIQQRMGLLQAALEAQMEQPVIGVHPVVIRGIFPPDAVRLHRVETGGVLRKERLHISHLEQALVVTGDALVPRHGAAFFHHKADRLHLDDVVADLFHQAGQDALVNAGEAGGIHQIGHRQLGETLGQMCFLLHIPCGLI